MCKGSAYVLHQSEAVTGDAYAISNGGDGSVKVAVLHLPGLGHREKDGRIQCAACIKVETPVEVVGVPIPVQEKYGIGPTLRGMFVPGGERHDDFDYIVTKTDIKVLLNDLIDEEVRLELRPVSSATPVREADVNELALT